MSEEFKHWLFYKTSGKLFFTLLSIIALWILIRFIKIAISSRIKENDSRYRLKKLISFLGYVFTFLIIVLVFSSSMHNLTVALGIAGAGIAFALQEVIASFAGWLAIIFGGFYKTGDRVQLGGIKGDVIDIGALRTTLMEIGQWVDGDLYNGRVVRIANSFVFKEPVFNYSGDFAYLWDEIKVSVQYGSNYTKAKEIFLSIADEICGGNAKEAQHMWDSMLRKYLVENAITEPMVTMVANNNYVEYTIRYIVDYKKRRSTRDKLFSRILEEITKTGRDIQFASASIQTIQLVQPQDPNLKKEEKDKMS